jgi:hypothetical protein
MEVVPLNMAASSSSATKIRAVLFVSLDRYVSVGYFSVGVRVKRYTIFAIINTIDSITIREMIFSSFIIKVFVSSKINWKSFILLFLHNK